MYDIKDNSTKLTNEISKTSVSKNEEIVAPSNNSKLSFAKDVPLIPFINMKYDMDVKATPPKIEPTHLDFCS